MYSIDFIEYDLLALTYTFIYLNLQGSTYLHPAPQGRGKVKLTKHLLEYSIDKEVVTVVGLDGKPKIITCEARTGYAAMWKLGIPSYSQNTISKKAKKSITDELKRKEEEDMINLLG